MTRTCLCSIYKWALWGVILIHVARCEATRLYSMDIFREKLFLTEQIALVLGGMQKSSFPAAVVMFGAAVGLTIPRPPVVSLRQWWLVLVLLHCFVFPIAMRFMDSAFFWQCILEQQVKYGQQLCVMQPHGNTWCSPSDVHQCTQALRNKYAMSHLASVGGKQRVQIPISQKYRTKYLATF